MDPTDEITSLLWKAALLARESVFFPRLVETAANHLDKTYSDHMLRTVAASPALLSALQLPVGEGVDAVLTSLASNVEAGAVMDGLIMAAVSAYVSPGGA